MCPRILSLVEGAVSSALERGTMDVMSDLAAPVTRGVVTSMLGLEGLDFALYQRWSDALVRAAEPNASVSTLEQANVVTIGFLEVLREYVRDVGCADAAANLAFGRGAHFCTSASLARLEHIWC